MKYDKETTDKLLELYKNGEGLSPRELAEHFSSDAELVPERSIIAKLSSLGVYKKKVYLNKRGEVPIRKEEYIERIAEHLNASIELLESLEKVNKNVLAMIDKALDLNTTSGA